MPTPEETYYISFVQWLKRQYPELYGCCWQFIGPPVTGRTIIIEKNSMSADSYLALIKAQEEFNQLQ